MRLRWCPAFKAVDIRHHPVHAEVQGCGAHFCTAAYADAMEYQYPPHMRQGSYAEEGRSVNTLKVRRDGSIIVHMAAMIAADQPHFLCICHVLVHRDSLS